MMTLFFNADRCVDWATASRSDTRRFARWFWELIDRGVYMPCSQYEALFISAAHSEADIDATIQAAADILPRLADGESSAPTPARSSRDYGMALSRCSAATRIEFAAGAMRHRARHAITMTNPPASSHRSPALAPDESPECPAPSHRRA